MNKKIFPVKIFFEILILILIFNSPAVSAISSVSSRPDRMTLYSSPVFRGTVMSAYQQAYAMNFEIWKPQGLPAGWYATFDGFPVAQIAENRWVYGQLGIDGAIRPTNILIGSVIPANVPGLLRIAATEGYTRFVNDEAFRKIREYRIDHMGWLNDGYLNTVIAWHSSEPDVIIWLGNRWKRLTPNQGEYTWQMLKRLRAWIVEELHKNGVFYPVGEPYEAADLSRQWGIHWSGRVILDTLRAFRDSGGNGNATSLRDSSSSTSGGNSGGRNNSGPQWDVD